MFTGIIEAQSRVQLFRRQKNGALLVLSKPKNFKSLSLGSSIAVNGVCLTVVRQDAKQIFFQTVAETLRRSNLGSLKSGQCVNLERALSIKSRIEGHFVLGHVDGLGVIREIRKQGMGRDFRIAIPASISPFVLEKGSIAIDGVSLTVGKVDAHSFWVYAIPHTLKATGMGAFKKGRKVNLETDILLKFLHRLMIS